MDPITQWQYETLGKRAVKALEKNKFTAAYFPDRESAALYALSLVADGASVGVGGSQTIAALNITDRLKSKNCTVLDHNAPDLSKEERLEFRHRQLAADVFICSSNAVTMGGELVNTDGTGNRVAAMSFGPKKVIVVAGANKLVKDLEQAGQRIKMLAAPLNNKRLGSANPCVSLGECADCHHDTRICNITTIISRRPILSDFHVLIVGEALGY